MSNDGDSVQDETVQCDSPSARRFGAISTEVYPWQPSYDVEAISRRKRDALPSSYAAAVPAQIAEASFDLPAALAAEAEDAATTIIKLDAYVSAKFGAEDIAPMQSVLLRTESAASSQIENLTVGARQLAIAELGGVASKNATLVSRNVAAMTSAVRLADALDLDAILAMHAALLSDHDDQAGRWREVQVWIGSSGLSPAGATFIPPHADRLVAALADLERFFARTDLPVLVQAAIAHAQFETIHPFTDGNGRTGRALLQAMVRHFGLTSRVTVPISAGLLADTDSYFEALTAFRGGDVAPIVRQLCQASDRAAVDGRWLVDALDELRHEWLGAIRARAGSAGRALVGLVIGQPAISVGYLERQLGVSNTAARRAVEQAVSAGILAESSDRKRDRIFVASEIIDILDEFVERAGRRS
jgi:Fic family protein